jgi:cell division septation protein DedD
MRFRVALVFALALATVTACGRGQEEQPPAQQRPATRVPMPPKPDSARMAARRTQAQAMPAPDTMKKPAPPTPAAARPAGKLYTVQVAAFVNADSARSWTGRLSSQGLPVWTTAYQLHGRTFHRVRVGAVPTVAEARKLGEMLKKRYSWSFWIAPVGDADAVPDGAVQATQRIITG